MILDVNFIFLVIHFYRILQNHPSMTQTKWLMKQFFDIHNDKAQ